MADTTTTGNWFVDKLSLYQSANSDNASIKNNFVIRQAEFDIIISELKNKTDKDPLQHELLLGRRGSGKSTLLRRIQAEIEENKQLQKKYVAVNLAEEQAGIYRLFDLWDEVLKELAVKFNIELDLKSYADFKDDQAYTRYLYEVVHDILANLKRKVVLLLDNFDRIVGNISDDGHLLRETLLNYNDIQIIAGSTRMDEHFWQYDKPFYEFFRRHRLEALGIAEIVELLNHWSVVMDLPQLAQFAKNNIGKLEAIRILTDGLPRTLQFFIQILLQNSNLYGYEYLKKVMDNVTTLYQERLNTLPAAHRKIIAEMAFIWEACTTKDLVEKCKMQSKFISANIKQLSNAGIIDTISTDKRNHLYRISERFFNMWLIVTQGNPEQKRRAKWLSIFLETWYDGKDLKQLAEEHITNLQDNTIGYDRALVFTKALSQSKYITTKQRDRILDLTEAIQPREVTASLLELPKKYSSIANEISVLIDQMKYDEALRRTEEIENEEDGVKFGIKGFIYVKQKKHSEAEKYYLLAIEKGNADALTNLAILYGKQKKYSEEEKYYLLATEKANVDALFNLAILYDNRNKYAEAEKYYLLAIEKGDAEATFNLANLYDDQKKYAEAEKYYLLAIEMGDVFALFNLAFLYSAQKKYVEAEKYYLLAIEKGDVDALFNLAILYSDQKKYPEAEKYYLLAIEKEQLDARFNLATLYHNQERYTEAENLYLSAIEKGHVDASFNLAHLYLDQEILEKAEKYYLLAIENGSVNAQYNLANLYSDQKKYTEAEKHYLLAIEKGHVSALFNLANIYIEQERYTEAEKYYLLAIEKGHVSALNNLAILYDNQKKYTKAEEYYLLAIEKGDAKALNNLSDLFYETNIKKADALDLIGAYNNQLAKNGEGIKNKINIEVWNGVFDGLDGKIETLLKEFGYDNLASFLTRLLYQEQVALVLNLFTGPQHGEELQKRYAPLYYAVLLLNNKTADNIILRIPPEILPTVNDIIKDVKEKQQFYATAKN